MEPLSYIDCYELKRREAFGRTIRKADREVAQQIFVIGKNVKMQMGLVWCSRL
ncbi:hypothetical protein P3G55_00895 [Leptospira sp. 96542]|nr:hypothetical protein [Leptospira sp. 96542]